MRAPVGTTGARVRVRYLRRPAHVAGARACENIKGLVPPSTCAAQEAEAAERSRGAARVAGIWASCDATGALGPAAAGRRTTSHR